MLLSLLVGVISSSDVAVVVSDGNSYDATKLILVISLLVRGYFIYSRAAWQPPPPPPPTSISSPTPPTRKSKLIKT